MVSPVRVAVSIVSVCHTPRRSQAPTCTSAKTRAGATNGFEMLAARYSFRRFNLSSVPTAQQIIKWNPNKGRQPIKMPTPMAAASRPAPAPSVLRA